MVSTSQVRLRAIEDEGEGPAPFSKGSRRFTLILADTSTRIIKQDLGRDVTAAEVTDLCKKLKVTQLEGTGFEDDIRKAMAEAKIECVEIGLPPNTEEEKLTIFKSGEEVLAIREVVGDAPKDRTIAILKGLAGTYLQVDWVYPNRLTVQGDLSDHANHDLREALRQLPCAECVMECMAVLKGEDAELTAFDLVSQDGEDFSGETYAQRLGRLSELFKGWKIAGKTPGDGAVVMLKMADTSFMTLEGPQDIPDAADHLAEISKGNSALLLLADAPRPAEDEERTAVLYTGKGVKKNALKDLIGQTFQVLKRLRGGT